MILNYQILITKNRYFMNIQQMMKQAQSMQKKMQEVQKKMDDIEVTGTAGGGTVSIITTGKGEVKKV